MTALALSCALSDRVSQSLPQRVAATETATPSDTPRPQVTETSAASLTPPPSELPQETSTATATFTASPLPASATPNLDDPRYTLPDQPDWADHFDTDENWSLYTSETASAQILDGQFIYRKIPEWSGAEWITTQPKAEYFYLEVTTRTSLRCEGTDRYGLVFSAPTSNVGEFFTVTCDGLMRLYVWNGKTRTDLVDWRYEEAINAGPNKVNRLGVKKQDGKTSLFINGKMVEEINDGTIPKAGRFGFVIASAHTANFIVAFDDLLLWQLP